MAQEGRNTSKLNAIARESTYFTCFVIEKFTESFIRIALDVLSQNPHLPLIEQCRLAVQLRKRRIIEKTLRSPAAMYSLLALNRRLSAACERFY